MGKFAIVTGAGRGIGSATAQLLAKEGFNICVNYTQDGARAAATVAACRKRGVRAEAFQADVADPAAVKALFAFCDDEFGAPDALVNNAGIVGQRTDFTGLTDKALRDTFAVNVFGTAYCIREAIPRMSTAKGGQGGVIVNLSSIAATLGSPGEYVHYAASKAAVDALTIGLSKELGPEGIRVNSVQAGTTDTEIHQRIGNPERPINVAKAAPLRRVATAEDIAESIIWLCSDKASYTTGAVLRVGGGL